MTMFLKWRKDNAWEEQKEVFFTETEALRDANKEQYDALETGKRPACIKTIEQANVIFGGCFQYTPFTLTKTGVGFTFSFENLMGHDCNYTSGGTHGVKQFLHMLNVKDCNFITYMLLNMVNKEQVADEPCNVSSTISNMTNEELENRLDRCNDHCNKYYSCNTVAEMNDKLATEEQKGKEVKWEYRVSYINIGDFGDSEPFDTISAYNLTTDMITKAEHIGSVYSVENFFKEVNLSKSMIGEDFCIYYKVDTNNPNNIVILNKIG